MRQAFGLEFSAAERAAFAKALDDLDARVEAVAAAGEDRAVADLMDPGSPWNAALHAFSTYYNGAGFDEISTIDYDAFSDTEVNWRTPRGYGALIATYGAGAPVLFNTRVERIDHAGSRVRLITPQGVLEAGCVILTLPTPLIADGHIVFEPELPELREAAAALPLGLANKVFLAVSEPEALPVESHLFGDISRVETGSYHLRPFGRAMIELYLGGKNARTLEAEGPGAGTAFAIEELVRLLGSDMRTKLHPVAESRWAADPFAGGSYSYARRGLAHFRATYAQPIEDRIFIAGEAASAHHFSTAHGAAETGIAAARAALEALGVGPQQSRPSPVVEPRP